MAINFLDWPAEWRKGEISERVYRHSGEIYVLSQPNGYFVILPQHDCSYPCNGTGEYVNSWREANGCLARHAEMIA